LNPRSSSAFHPGCIFATTAPLEVSGISIPENRKFIATGVTDLSVKALVYHLGSLVCIDVPKNSIGLMQDAATRYDLPNATAVGLSSIARKIVSWSTDRMGPPSQLGPMSALRRIKRMVDPALENPADIGNYAVIVFWLMDALHRAGFSVMDLFRALLTVCEQYANSSRLVGEQPDYPFVPTAIEMLNQSAGPDLFRFTLQETVFLPDGESVNSLSGFITITGNRMEISLNGYGECEANDGEGSPVVIELVQNQPIVVMFPDINDSAAEIVSLENAREDQRE
jgi:hypothetical protein